MTFEWKTITGWVDQSGRYVVVGSLSVVASGVLHPHHCAPLPSSVIGVWPPQFVYIHPDDMPERHHSPNQSRGIHAVAESSGVRFTGGFQIGTLLSR